ncbi:MAG: urease accessory UreF family protein [Ilumatobacteraceae bacterium]
MEASHGRGDLRTIADLEAFLDGRLCTVAPTDAAFTAASCAHPSRRADLDAELAARTPSPRLRALSRSLGRQLLRPAARAWPSTAYDTLRAVHPDGPMQAVALGAVAAAAGLGPERAALVSAHHLVGAITTAAVRLIGLDPFDVQAMAAARAPPRAARRRRRARRRAIRGRRPAPVHHQPARRRPRRAPRHLGGEALCLLNTNPASPTMRATATPTAITTACPTTPSGRMGPRAHGRCGSASAARWAAARRRRRGAVPAAQAGGEHRGRHQRHLHHRRRRGAAADGRAPRRPDRAGRDRCLPAHRHPR